MINLLFNSNNVIFQVKGNGGLSSQIPDNSLFEVQCICNSWPVDDIYQQWGVNDFPEKPALRIAYFQIQEATDNNLSPNDTELYQYYWCLLHPINDRQTKIPILCETVPKQFFGVATDQNSAVTIASLEDKHVWITVTVRTSVWRDYSWRELVVNRQDSSSWSSSEVRFG